MHTHLKIRVHALELLLNRDEGLCPGAFAQCRVNVVDLFMKLISNVDYEDAHDVKCLLLCYDEDAYDVKCLLLFMMRKFMLSNIIVELYA